MQRQKLTKKQKAFADEYITTGNGTKSALKAYETNDYSTAGNIASDNLKNPKIEKYLESHVAEAKAVIYELMTKSDNDRIRIDAAKDIIDRVDGKAVTRIGGEEKGQPIMFMPAEIITKNEL